MLLTVSPYTNHSGQPLTPDLAGGPSSRFFDFLEQGDVFEKGYTYVYVDLRGTGGSQGCNDWGGPGEQADVKAAVEWAATREWSTGKVALYGKSYDAWTGLMAIAQRPQGLAAVISQEPVVDGYRYLYTNRVRFPNALSTPALFQIIDAQPGHPSDSPEYQANNLYANVVKPGCYATNIADQQDNEPESAYWAPRHLVDAVEGSHVPTFMMAGFLEDNTKPDAVFELGNNLASDEDRAWFGPWDHVRGNDRAQDGTYLAGRVTFVAEAMRFLDEHLKGVAGDGRARGRQPRRRRLRHQPGRRRHAGQPRRVPAARLGHRRLRAVRRRLGAAGGPPRRRAAVERARRVVGPRAERRGGRGALRLDRAAFPALRARRDARGRRRREARGVPRRGAVRGERGDDRRGGDDVRAARAPAAALGGELPAELRERALLAVVERRERARHSGGVLREQAVHQLLSARRDRDGRRPAVVRQPAALHQPAPLERPHDLGRVRLRGAQPPPQRAQLQLAVGGDEHDQHREARRRQPLALEVGAEPAAHGRLRAQQPVERAMRQRVVHDEPHRAAILRAAPDTRLAGMGRALTAVGAALVLLIGGLGLAVYVTRDEDNIQADNLLSERFTREVATTDTVDLSAVAPFPWASVLLVERGTPREAISERLGYEWTGTLGFEVGELLILLDGRGQVVRFLDYRGEGRFAGIDTPFEELPRDRAVFRVRDLVITPTEPRR